MDIEISRFQEEGYKPIVDYMEWRVAVLRYCEELEIDNIAAMQKHTQTDEVFVLLEGLHSFYWRRRRSSWRDSSLAYGALKNL